MQWRRTSFPGHEAQLAGDLIFPDGGGPHPAVVLLQGAGQGERDYYRPHAATFAEAGLASLIFDRRGEGESTGARNMDLFVLAKDAAAAVRAMRNEPLVDPARVGLWGYSNGAWVASVAAGDCDPAFVVLAGAAGVSPAEAEVYRRTEELRRRGVTGAGLAAVEETWRIIFASMGGEAWQDTWDDQLAVWQRAIARDPLILELPVSEWAKVNPQFDSVPRFESPLFANLRALEGTSPDFGYDPIPFLAELTCPVLVVLAEDDANVPVALSLPRFEELAGARPGAFEVRVLPGADHLFSSPEFTARGGGDTPGTKRTAVDYRSDFLRPMGEWMARVTAG